MHHTKRGLGSQLAGHDTATLLPSFPKHDMMVCIFNINMYSVHMNFTLKTDKNSLKGAAVLVVYSLCCIEFYMLARFLRLI